MRQPYLLIIPVFFCAYVFAGSNEPEQLIKARAQYNAKINAASAPIKKQYMEYLLKLKQELIEKDDLAGALVVKREFTTLQNAARKQPATIVVTTNKSKDGLVTHFSFDETLNDEFERGQINLRGGDISYEKGILGSSVKLSGESVYLDLKSTELYNFSKEKSSISFWFNYPEISTPSKSVSLLDKATASDFGIFIKDRDSFHELDVRVMRMDDSGDLRGYASFRTKVEAEKWNNLILVKDSAMLTLYLNGELVDSTEVPHVRSTNNPIVIGGDMLGVRGESPVSAPDYDYTGRIDELKFYETALTAEDAAQEWSKKTSESTE